MNELDLNLSRCLVEKQNFTYTEVTNVCNVEAYQVPHCTLDYLIGGFPALLLGGLIVLLGVGVYAFARDY